MKKADLVSALAEETGSTKAAATDFLAALESITKAAVATGGKVVIPGVVTITVADRAARTFRNPATGAPVERPATRVVKAKPPADLVKAA